MGLLSKTARLQEKNRRAKALTPSLPIILDTNFPKQTNFVKDTARYIAAKCTRRAGKTNGLGLRFTLTALKYPKSQQIYLGLTRDSAKGAMWPVMQEINDRYRLGMEFVESKLIVKFPNGAVLYLLGADMANYIKRLRGRKFPGVAIDEAQDFGPHLESLIDDVLTPAISDYSDGWLAVTGTPGPVPQGLFFDITQNNKYGFSVHKWSLYENPNMPNPQAMVDDLIKRKGWLPDNPTFLREWQGEWVLDTKALWVHYNAQINNFDTLPSNHKWNYIIGLDIGFRDADAIAVIAWSETSKETYLVEELLTKKQNISDMVAQVDKMQKKYDAYKIVMDAGALGKKIHEEIIRRFACPIVAADKANKQDNVEFLNDSLRLGKFKAKADSQFAQDSYLVQIDWDKSTTTRIALRKAYHSDIIDAVLYAFRDSYAFAHKPEGPPKPAWGSKEWAEQQQNDMFDAAMENALSEIEENKRQNGIFD